MTIGYYSIIQFCPDVGRMEVVNVGVVLYLPDSKRLLVSITNTLQRIIRFFGENTDMERIPNLIASVASRLSLFENMTRDELEQYITSRANNIYMTPLRQVKFDCDENTELEQLYKELVE